MRFVEEISLILVIKIILICMISYFLFHRIEKSTIPDAFSQVLWGPHFSTENQEKSS